MALKDVDAFLDEAPQPSASGLDAIDAFLESAPEQKPTSILARLLPIARETAPATSVPQSMGNLPEPAKDRSLDLTTQTAADVRRNMLATLVSEATGTPDVQTPAPSVAPVAPQRQPVDPQTMRGMARLGAMDRQPTTAADVIRSVMRAGYAALPKDRLQSRVSRDVTSGVAQIPAGFANAANWLTGGNETVQQIEAALEAIAQETTPPDQNYLDKVATGLGSVAGFGVPALWIAKALGQVARVAPTLASWIAPGSAAVMEAGVEAGNAFKAVLKLTKDRTAAEEAAKANFGLNVGIIALTNKLGVFGESGQKLRKAIAGFINEGTQEALQEVAQQWPSGATFDRQAIGDILEAGSIGAIIGGGIGAVTGERGRTADARIQEILGTPRFGPDVTANDAGVLNRIRAIQNIAQAAKAASEQGGKPVAQAGAQPSATEKIDAFLASTPPEAPSAPTVAEEPPAATQVAAPVAEAQPAPAAPQPAPVPEGVKTDRGPLHDEAVRLVEEAPVESDGFRHPKTPRHSDETFDAASQFGESLPDGTVLVDALGNKWRMTGQFLEMLNEQGEAGGTIYNLRDARSRGGKWNPSRGALVVLAESRVDKPAPVPEVVMPAAKPEQPPTAEEPVAPPLAEETKPVTLMGDGVQAELTKTPDGIRVRLIDTESGEPLEGVRVYPADQYDKAVAWAKKTIGAEPKTEDKSRTDATTEKVKESDRLQATSQEEKPVAAPAAEEEPPFGDSKMLEAFKALPDSIRSDALAKLKEIETALDDPAIGSYRKDALIKLRSKLTAGVELVRAQREKIEKGHKNARPDRLDYGNSLIQEFMDADLTSKEYDPVEVPPGDQGATGTSEVNGLPYTHRLEENGILSALIWTKQNELNGKILSASHPDYWKSVGKTKYGDVVTGVGNTRAEAIADVNQKIPKAEQSTWEYKEKEWTREELESIPEKSPKLRTIAFSRGLDPTGGARKATLIDRILEDQEKKRATEIEVVPPSKTPAGLSPEGSGTATLSNEELARTETFYHAKRDGSLTFLGKQPDATLRPGEAVIAVGKDGTLRVANSKLAGKDAEVLKKYGAAVRKATAPAEEPKVEPKQEAPAERPVVVDKPPPGGWKASDKVPKATPIGKNADGLDIFEDKNGARYVIQNGVRQTQPVMLMGTLPIVQKPAKLYETGRTQFLTQEEMAQFAKPKEESKTEPKEEPKETPAELAKPDVPPEAKGAKVLVVAGATGPGGKWEGMRWRRDILRKIESLPIGSRLITLDVGDDPTDQALVYERTEETEDGATWRNVTVSEDLTQDEMEAAVFAGPTAPAARHVWVDRAKTEAEPPAGGWSSVFSNVRRRAEQAKPKPAPLTPAPAAPTLSPEEVSANVTAAPDVRTPLPESRPDGTVVSPALGEVPAEDVRRPGVEGEPRGERQERVPADRGGDQGAGAEGVEVPGGEERRPGGVYVPASGDVTAEETPAEPDLPTEGEPTATLLNYRITDADNLGEGGKVAKYNDNIAAIRLLKQIEAEGRLATPAEQAILVKYVGWGGIPQVFNPWENYSYTDNGRQEADAWEKRQRELSELLTPEEYDRARRSVLNAHYTSKPIIDTIWKAVQHLGFKRGRVLEPGAGVGHFLGLMPPSVARGSSISAVELDDLTGRILKQLYQRADVRIEGFEAAQFADGWFDIVVGNWPFGSYKPFDTRYNRLKLRIHNYFTIKALDKVKSGGIVAFITSTGTLDSRSGLPARKLMAEQAVFLGAVRLPSSTFKKNALTEVTTDIIFLQKKGPGVTERGIPFQDVAKTGLTAEVKDMDAKVKYEHRRPTKTVDLTINEYFQAHPENVLGDLADDKLHPGRIAVNPRDGMDVKAELDRFIQTLPANTMAEVSKAVREEQKKAEESRIPAPDDLLEGNLQVRDGKVYRKAGPDMIEETSLPKGVTPARVKALTKIRSAARDVFRTQSVPGTPDAEIQQAMKQLNKAYDAFVKKYGPIGLEQNRRAFWQDPELPALLALENYDPDTDTATKAPIFTQRTIQARERATKADDPQQAMLIALDESGTLDFDRMAELTGLDVPTIQRQLRGLLYEAPDGQWYTASEYLSGNVREKLAQARAAAKLDKKYQPNVDALEQVQPADLLPSQINVRLGAPWVPVDVIRAFVHEITGVRDEYINVQHAELTGEWKAWVEKGRSNTRSTSDWGTDRRPAIDLIAAALNGTLPEVKGKDNRIDQVETAAARDKQAQIKERFGKWVWEDAERADLLSRIYNDTYNHSVWRTYDGSHLTLPGQSSTVTLRPHQKNAIYRILQTGVALLDHVVGSGKTFTMVGAAMELRRTGLAKKPLMVVPNHRLGSTAAEWKQLYPAANILVAEAEDFEEGNRKRLMARIATGVWDGVIVPESSFVRLPVSFATQKEYVEEEIRELELAILEAQAEKGKDNRIVKRLEDSKANLEGRLALLLAATESHQDVGLTWEQLGVDFLFVDEAHHYKNLFFITKKRRIAGLGQGDAQRATDMYLKIRHLLKLNNGRGIVFATGTPISNTIAEMFTMLRYLAPQALRSGGMQRFDPWTAMFADERSDVEFTADGRFTQRTRLSRFTNLPELLRMYRNVADVVGASDVKLPLPKAERHNIQVKMSAAQESFFREIAARVDAITGPPDGRPDPKDDNLLKVSTDGRKATLDMRLIDPEETDYQHGKLHRAADEIARIYKETAANRSTQFVFMDMGTPQAKKGKAAAGNLYDDLRKKLVARGVKKDEIAFIQDAKDDQEKQAMIRRMNLGKVRVLIGSTPTMGEGTNAQRKAVALHHIDPPWKPAEIEQREGRIIRQGNEHFDQNLPVQVYTYITEGHRGGASFDAYMWQALQAKAKFIDQLRRGNLNVREAEDVSDFVLSSGELKALASGNPLALEQVKLMGEVRRLSMLEAKHQDDQHSMRRNAAYWPGVIENYKAKAERFRKAEAFYRQNKPDKFSMTIGATTYTDRDAAGAALENAIANETKMAEKSGVYSMEPIGTYAGAQIEFAPASSKKFMDTLQLRFPNGAVLDMETFSVLGIEAMARNINAHALKAEETAKEYAESLSDVQARLGKPFEHAERLATLQTQLAEINGQLLHDRQEGDVLDDSDDPEADDEEESVGPGAQAVGEFAQREPFTTSTKNAVKDRERQARGLEPLYSQARLSNAAAWDQAMQWIDDDPDIQDRLLSELALKPRAVSATENALLLHRSVNLINERNDLARQLFQAVEKGFTERADQLRAATARLSDELVDLEKILRAVGTESGRSLQARKMMVDQDYTLAAMETRKRIAKGGDPLTEAEQAEIARLHAQIADMQEKIQQYEEAARKQVAPAQVDAAVQEMTKRVTEEVATERKQRRPRDPGKMRDAIIAGITSSLEEDATLEDLRPFVQRLAETFIREGVTTRDPLIDKVHEVLVELIPELTRRQTMDAISGFGDFSPLNPDPVKVTLRDLKGQMQQVAKLENIMARRPVPKTGVERRVPSDEERRLIQQVEEAKRRYGVIVTDQANQLKSVLDAIKTRLRHEIVDLEYQIATREKIVKSKSPTPTDAEVERLRAQRDSLKQQYQEIFKRPGLTEAQQIARATAALERSIDSLEARIKAKDVLPRTWLRRQPTSPELEALRVRQTALREQLQELRDLDATYQERQRLQDLERQISEYERRVKTGDLAPQPGKETVKTSAVQAAEARRDAAKAALEAIRERVGYYDAKREADALARLEASLEDLRRKIREHDLSPRVRAMRLADTPEIRRARLEHALLSGVLKEMRAAAKPQKSLDERMLQSLKTRMAHKAAQLTDKLEQGDFRPPVKRAVTLDAEGKKLRAELDKITREFREGLVKDRLARRTRAQKTLAGVVESTTITRLLMTAYDLSAFLRQGGFTTFGHPILATRALVGTLPAIGHPLKALKELPNLRKFWQALGAEDVYHALNEELLSRPNAALYHRAKLYFSDQEGNLSQMEEAYMSRWAQKIPGVGASQRAYTAFLNRLRADAFDAMLAGLRRGPEPTIEEAKALANFINVATGRGKIGAHEATAVGLNSVFFAPRYLASRVQLLAGQPFYGGSGRTRARVAGEYARYLAGVAILYALAASAGADFEWDPRSADFGKIRFGKTRIDVLTGFSQLITFLYRVIGGETKTQKGQIRALRGPQVRYGQDDTADVIARFLRTKLSPNVGIAVDALTGSDVIGRPVTPTTVLQRSLVPLSFGDIYEAMQAQGVPAGSALAVLSILGVGLNTYEPRKPGAAKKAHAGGLPTWPQAKRSVLRWIRERAPQSAP